MTCIEKHPKYGWTVTTLAPEAKAWIISILGYTGIHASRLQATGSAKGMLMCDKVTTKNL